MALPPPPEQEDGFAYTFTPDLPPIDDRELRLYIIKAVLETKGIQEGLGTGNIVESMDKIIVPAAVRMESYIREGK